jgi:hypothetical protein
MSLFDNQFNTDLPTGVNLASDLDDIIKLSTKRSLDERYMLEHFSLNSGGSDTGDEDAQGRHKAGLVGCLGYGTEAERQALPSDPPSGIGSIFYETDTGLVKVYLTGGWVTWQFGVGTLYATAAEIETGTEDNKAISPLTLRQADTEFVLLPTPITILGTVDLDPDLDQAGIDITNLTALHCKVEGQAVGGTFSQFNASLPDGTASGTLTEIFYYQLAGTDILKRRDIVVIPVNRITESVTFSKTGSVLDFELFAVTQRTYAE